MTQLGVLISGRGTNLQAIIDAVRNKEISARIAVVISNKKHAFGLERARKYNIPNFFISAKGKTPVMYDSEILEIFKSYGVDLVVLAGYLKILTPVFIRAYRNRIINIHPALLPAFGGKGYYGLAVHKAVLDAGCKISGCTVHFVTEAIDAGPIIVQKPVVVLDSDTPETLAARILPYEHKALIEAIKAITEKKYRIEGNRVIFEN